MKGKIKRLNLLEAKVRPVYAEVIKEEGYFPRIQIYERHEGCDTFLIELWEPDLSKMLKEVA